MALSFEFSHHIGLLVRKNISLDFRNAKALGRNIL
jgi:hypothetical protein